MNENGKKILESVSWISRKIKILVLLVCLAIFVFISSESIGDYLMYKNKVMKVEATVVDSLNYINQVSDDYYYKSNLTLNWRVNNEVYEGEFKKSGTLLKGDKVIISVLKDSPNQVKAASLSNALASIILPIIFTVIIFVAFKYKMLYRKFILMDKNNKDDNEKFIDIGEEEENIRRRGKRVRIFYLIVGILFTIAFIWVSNRNYQEYIAEKERQDIEVQCLVLEADNYNIGEFEFSDIIGEWNIDGQIYKKSITKTIGTYEKGEIYPLIVKSDTKDSVKLDKIPDRNILVLTIIGAISGVIVIVRNVYGLLRLN